MADFSAAVASVRQKTNEIKAGEQLDPLAAAVRQTAAARDVQNRAALVSATQVNPDQAAKDLDLSRKTGLPTDVVREQRETVQANHEFNTVDLERLKRESPKLNDSMRDPDTAAVVRDDVENLSWFERFIGNTKQGLQQGVQTKELADIGFKMLTIS